MCHIVKSFTTLLALLSTIVLSGLAQAQVVKTEKNFIQGGHSGAWYDVAQPGHGLFVEVMDDAGSATGKSVFAAWFAFHDDQQIWLIGQGDVIKENDGYAALLEVGIYEGNEFPPDYRPNETIRSDWGEIVLTFTGCDEAQILWDATGPGFEDGELEMRRLTTISGTGCIPNLGGEAADDDHGDSWASATYLTNLGTTQRSLDAMLEVKGDIDVFAFTLTSTRNVQLYTFGLDNLDTVGTLYKIVNSKEVKVTENDNGTGLLGFKIEEQLGVGSYTLHVRGKNDNVKGGYRLYYQLGDG
jgi:hypothetical protein